LTLEPIFNFDRSVIHTATNEHGWQGPMIIYLSILWPKLDWLNRTLFVLEVYWVPSTKIHHRLIWSPQQNCSNTICVSAVAGSFHWLLSQWAQFAGLWVFVWSNSKLPCTFSFTKIPKFC
jgi:hypothetical protein